MSFKPPVIWKKSSTHQLYYPGTEEERAAGTLNLLLPALSSL